MSMAMEHDVRAMTVDDFCQTRTTEVRINFRRFSANGVADRRIVKDHDSFGSAQLGHGALQLQGFIDRGLHKCLDLRLAESSQRASSKASGKTFSAGEANAIAFVRRAIQQLDARVRHHAYQFGLQPTLVVVIPQNSHDGQAKREFNSCSISGGLP